MNRKIICIMISLTISGCIGGKYVNRKNIQKDWYTYSENIKSDPIIQLDDNSFIYNDTSKIDWTKDLYYWEYLSNNKYRFKIFYNTKYGLTQPYIFKPEKWKVVEKNNKYYLRINGSNVTNIYKIENYIKSDSLKLHIVEN